MKKVLIINGSGGVGKGTFVEKLSELIKVDYISIADVAKRILYSVGWRGTKNDADRKALAEIKRIIDEYGDVSFQEITGRYAKFKYLSNAEILCIDMREQKDIVRAIERFGAKTVLVTRDSAPEIKTNFADANIAKDNYDFYVKNDGTIDDLKEQAQKIIEKLLEDECLKPILYTTNCVKCKQLEFELRKREIPFKLETNIEVMKDMGITSAPYLFIDGQLLDHAEALTYIRRKK